MSSSTIEMASSASSFFSTLYQQQDDHQYLKSRRSSSNSQPQSVYAETAPTQREPCRRQSAPRRELAKGPRPPQNRVTEEALTFAVGHAHNRPRARVDL